MVITLFIIGVLTSLGFGFNVVFQSSTWQHELIRFLGGALGSGLMVTALLISRNCI